GTEVADPIARRHRVQYVQPRVQHAEHDFGVEGTKDLARVALLLVLELDIENVAGELRKSEPFRLRGSIDVDFAPVLTGSHRPFLPPSSTYSCTHELVVEEWNAIVSSEASPPVRRCASARSGLRPNTRRKCAPTLRGQPSWQIHRRPWCAVTLGPPRSPNIPE